MNRFFLFALVLTLCFSACKTSDSPQSESTPATTANASVNAAATTAPAPLSKEDQHRFQALLKQGDHHYASGNFREALNFYKKAQALAPDQLGNEKLIACIKAMQEPSTRRKSKN